MKATTILQLWAWIIIIGKEESAVGGRNDLQTEGCKNG